ncbi:MAG: LPXTG cell wall anchor domain-containing protein [Streptosporangiaceae bacterium]
MGGEQPAQAGEELPFTGLDLGSLFALALGAIAVGGACVVAARRRLHIRRG